MTKIYNINLQQDSIYFILDYLQDDLDNMDDNNELKERLKSAINDLSFAVDNKEVKEI